MLMCSMDYGRYFLQEKGKVEYEKLIYICNLYRKRINALDGFHIISKEEIQVYDMDITRYVLQTQVGIDMYKLSQYLRNNKIQPEMCDGVNIIFIFSPFNIEEDFKFLYKILSECCIDDFKGASIMVLDQNIPHMEFKPFEVLLIPSETKYYRETIGRICKETIVPYPPGVPIILPGEAIDKETIKAMDYYIQGNVTILGMDHEFNIKVTRQAEKTVKG